MKRKVAKTAPLPHLLKQALSPHQEATRGKFYSTSGDVWLRLKHFLVVAQKLHVLKIPVDTLVATRLLLLGRFGQKSRLAAPHKKVESPKPKVNKTKRLSKPLKRATKQTLVAKSLKKSVQHQPPRQTQGPKLRQPRKPQRALFSRSHKKVQQALAGLLLCTSVLLGTVLSGPALYELVFPFPTTVKRPSDAGTAFGGAYENGGSSLVSQSLYQPPFDETLPEGNWIVIPRIGVRTEILESPTADAALEKGVWRVPEFGVPGDARQPMILTAHRWGYKRWWGSGYWKYHSFYELPQLEPGDRVEIITQQRKYVYEVYKAEESSEITDYQASVILYTCKFLNASVRHIRYLRLIDPERDTQK